MEAISAADSIPNIDLHQLENRPSFQLNASSYSQTRSKMNKSEVTNMANISTSSTSISDRPLLCRDILYRDECWASIENTDAGDVYTSESEQGSSTDSEPWSDDEEEDDDDEFVLCLTSHGARPLDSTSSLCPPLPRRFLFRPLEVVDEHVDEPVIGEKKNSQTKREQKYAQPLTPKSDFSPSIIFQNDYFTVSASQIAGWGAFAAKDLKYGDKILVEQPLFTADSSTLFKEFSKLDPELQELALSLHANEMCKPETPKLQAIWMANCFSTEVGDTAGLFPIASRFNHSCRPKDNVEYTFNCASGTLEMIVKAETIAANEELTISYGTKRTPVDLFFRYGFHCRCGACPGLTSNDRLVIW